MSCSASTPHFAKILAVSLEGNSGLGVVVEVSSFTALMSYSNLSRVRILICPGPFGTVLLRNLLLVRDHPRHLRRAFIFFPVDWSYIPVLSVRVILIVKHVRKVLKMHPHFGKSGAGFLSWILGLRRG